MRCKFSITVSDSCIGFVNDPNSELAETKLPRKINVFGKQKGKGKGIRMEYYTKIEKKIKLSVF